MDRTAFLAGLGGTALAAFDLPTYTAQVTIGVACPLSGPDRKMGEALADGVRAAVDDANRRRAGLDRAYALRTFDDQNSIADAIVNAQFATQDPAVIAVVGHLGAKATLAATRTYAEAGTALVVPSATMDAITGQGYRTVFRLPTRDFDEGRLLAVALLADRKPAIVHTLVQDGDYGADVANGFVQQLNARKVTNAVTLFSWEKPNFSQAADQALAAKPDAVLLAGTAHDMGGAIKVLREKGYAGALLASQGFFDPLTVTTYAKEAEGLTVSSSMPYLAIAPGAFRITNDYQSRYGAMQPVSAFAYAATEIIISAVRRSGATGRAALVRAMQLGGNYDTLVGSFTFDPHGDPTDPNCYFYTVRDGKFAYQHQAHPSSLLSH